MTNFFQFFEFYYFMIEVALEEFVTESFHGGNDIVAAQRAVSIAIKKAENRSKFVLFARFLNVDAGGHEFGVVDFVI